MTQNILIICSWLDTKTNVGIFFREQAAILEPEFIPTLVVFKRKVYSFKNIYKIKKYYNIIELKSPEKLNVLEVCYPEFTLIPDLLNKMLRDNAVNFLYSFLSKKDIKPSLIHAQSLFDAGFWAYKYCMKFNTPYIITEHNQITFLGVTPRKQLLAGTVLKNAKMKLVVSCDKIRQFGTNGYFYDFINVGNLISDEFYYNPNKEARETINIITIGAFNPLKDQKTIFEALSMADKLIDVIKLKFTWIGFNGWGKDETENVKGFLQNYEFKNIEIELFPTMERKDIADKLNNTDLFLFSSISEGMSVSVLEALACGIPVFSTNCGGVDEVINENNGKIYPIKDSYRLHQFIIEYIRNPKLYNGKNSILG